MSKTTGILRRAVPAVAIAAVILAALPPAAVHARADADPDAPPEPAGLRQNRLERLWRRQQRIHARMGKLFDHFEQRRKTAQGFIDRATASGNDTSELQAALDSFADSVRDARPLYESAQGLIGSHRGFDKDGRLTDVGMASETVREMADRLQELRALLLDSGRDLRQAVRAFREANHPE